VVRSNKSFDADTHRSTPTLACIVRRRALLGFGLTAGADHALSASRCFGTVNHGHLEAGVKLPISGPNFAPYSKLGVFAGRTYVHSSVAQVVGEAYAALTVATPSVKYVYGESGWASGGRLRPHRSHQNGLSVDFFVPVRDAKGNSVPLPTGPTNKFGYDIEFDSNGRFEQFTIDFSAIAEHLYQLHTACQAHGIGIAMAIFDKPYLPKLYAAAPRGEFVRQNIPFMKGTPWVRHDEHYHIDFAVPCVQDAS
jgi:penicillin-insensitive murein endopeptidase